MYFIRHGQSVFNAAFAETGLDPGVVDAPLTPRGFDEARGAGRLLAGKGITHIVSSPYTRALQTATAVNAVLQLPIAVEPLLGERRLYSCDIGTRRSVLLKDWPSIDFSRVEKEEWWPHKNESDGDIAGRVRAFAAQEADYGPSMLFVSHWYFIFTLSSMDMENGQVLWQDREGRFHKMV